MTHVIFWAAAALALLVAELGFGYSLRRAEGKRLKPTVAILDSQSARTTEGAKIMVTTPARR